MVDSIHSNGEFPNDMQTLRDFQEFHNWLDEMKGFGCDLMGNILCLMEEVGEVSEVIAHINGLENRFRLLGHNDARSRAVAQKRQELGEELADCLAYILKLATSAGIDLHEAYIRKQAKNIKRTWVWDDVTANEEVAVAGEE